MAKVGSVAYRDKLALYLKRKQAALANPRGWHQRALRRERHAMRLARDRANEQERTWQRIGKEVCLAAMALAGRAGCAVEMQHWGGGSTFDLIAADYRADVALVIRRVAAQCPRLAAGESASLRYRYRVRLGRAFQRAGLYPVANYFADARPAKPRTPTMDYCPPDVEWRRRMAGDAARRGANSRAWRRRAIERWAS